MSILAPILVALVISTVASADRELSKVTAVMNDGKAFDWELQDKPDGFSVFVFSTKKGDLKKNGPKIWSTLLFSRKYGGKVETDIEWIWLKSLELKDGILIAIDEAGQTYKVDSKTGRLIQPLKPKAYPPMGDPFK